MSNPWFRMYSEFAHDPKVQMLSETMQRRYIMLMCLRCSNALVTLHETEVAFALRISDEELATTKALFVARGFIDSDWNLLNWEKRQFASDSSAARVAKHRALKKEAEEKPGNAHVTLPQRQANALDTEQNRTEEPKGSVAKGDLPPCKPQAMVDLYHEVLPELPAVRLMNDQRRKALSKLWRWVLTSAKSDGTRRAYDADQALTWLREYFTRASENDFLMGRTGRNGEHANWQCDLDFLLTDKGMKHVIEKTKETA
jgi:hypothetical protein